MFIVEPFVKGYNVVSSQGLKDSSKEKQGYMYCPILKNISHLLSVLIVICLGLCGSPFEQELYLSICSVLCIQLV